MDAPRFLGRRFGDSEIVSYKLDEPAPYFGIPTGVYDTVQNPRSTRRTPGRFIRPINILMSMMSIEIS